MPGARLTSADRRAIAEGLAHGRTYTAIARALERPLSTVSREVARNGGPGGYDPDRADEAARARARRTPVPPRHDGSAGDGPAALAGIEEQFIGAMIASGLTRMTARVLTRLYLTDSGTLSAAELARGLRVSPASVSKAVGELERQSLIRRERAPGDRRDRYVIDADAWTLAWTDGARRNTDLAQVAYDGARSLGIASPAGMRLKGLGDFFDHVGRAMTEAARRWSAERTEMIGSQPTAKERNGGETRCQS